MAKPRSISDYSFKDIDESSANIDAVRYPDLNKSVDDSFFTRLQENWITPASRLFKPIKYKRGPWTFSGKVGAKADIGWDPSSSLTAFGGPKIENRKYTGNIGFDVGLGKRTKAYGGVDYATGVRPQYTAGLKYTFQNDGEVPFATSYTTTPPDIEIDEDDDESFLTFEGDLTGGRHSARGSAEPTLAPWEILLAAKRMPAYSLFSKKGIADMLVNPFVGLKTAGTKKLIGEAIDPPLSQFKFKNRFYAPKGKEGMIVHSYDDAVKWYGSKAEADKWLKSIYDKKAEKELFDKGLLPYKDRLKGDWLHRMTDAERLKYGRKWKRKGKSGVNFSVEGVTKWQTDQFRLARELEDVARNMQELLINPETGKVFGRNADPKEVMRILGEEKYRRLFKETQNKQILGIVDPDLKTKIASTSIDQNIEKLKLLLRERVSDDPLQSYPYNIVKAFQRQFGDEGSLLLRHARPSTLPYDKMGVPIGGKKVVETGPWKNQTGGEIKDKILQSNVDVHEWNKKYVQSDNYRDMLERAGLNEKEIQRRINSVLNFDPGTNITFNVNNPSMGMTYNTGEITSSGEHKNIYFPGGEDFINYNPNMMLKHTMYGPSVKGGEWPAVSAHEQGHLLGPDGLNRKTRKKLKQIAKENKQYLKEFSGGDKDAYKHAKDPEEMRANLLQLRFQMENAGLYKSTEGDVESSPFTIEDLKKIIEFNEDGSFKRYKPGFNNELLETIHPQDIIWMMNNIAMEPGNNLPEETMRAQRGGNIFKAQYGTTGTQNIGRGGINWTLGGKGPEYSVGSDFMGCWGGSCSSSGGGQFKLGFMGSASDLSREPVDYEGKREGDQWTGNVDIRGRGRLDLDTYALGLPGGMFLEGYGGGRAPKGQGLSGYYGGKAGLQFKSTRPYKSIFGKESDFRPQSKLDLYMDYASNKDLDLGAKYRWGPFNVGATYTPKTNAWGVTGGIGVDFQRGGNPEKTKEDRDFTGTTQGEIKSYTNQTLDTFKRLKDLGYDDTVIQYLYETFLVESSGGVDPDAGGNTMQIMPSGFQATQDIKSHPNLKNWHKKYKEDFDIDWNDITYEQVKADPFLGVLAARLHMANDPNPVGSTIEDRAKQWSLKYNTPADAAGDSTYYLNKVKEIQKAHPTIKYQEGSEVKYPSVSGHYVFDTDESRNIGLEGAPMGSSGTFNWDYKDARVLEGRQSYPVAVYADGIYQGILQPGGRLVTNPAFRVDEIPVGYQPPVSTLQYLASKAPKQKIDMTGKYNTGLSENDKKLYNIFEQSFGVTEDDKKDYDVQGLFASGDYKDPSAWESDKFKKPNHPTFSVESIYNEIDGNTGGEYTSDGEFEPGSANMKYNTMNDLITHLSTSGMRLKLAPYFQKAANIEPDRNKQYSDNADRIGYLRTLRQSAQYGGDVYNKADKELREIIINNRDIRTGLESDDRYEKKMKSLGVKKYQDKGEVSSGFDFNKESSFDFTPMPKPGDPDFSWGKHWGSGIADIFTPRSFGEFMLAPIFVEEKIAQEVLSPFLKGGSRLWNWAKGKFGFKTTPKTPTKGGDYYEGTQLNLGPTSTSPIIGRTKGWQESYITNPTAPKSKQIMSTRQVFPPNYDPKLAQNIIDNELKYINSEEFFRAAMNTRYKHLYYDSNGLAKFADQNLVKNAQKILKEDIKAITNRINDLKISYIDPKKAKDILGESTLGSHISAENLIKVKGSKDWANILRHEINHAYGWEALGGGIMPPMSLTPRIMCGDKVIKRVTSGSRIIGKHSLHAQFSKKYFDPNMTSKELGYVPVGKYEGYPMIEVHPSLRGKYYESSIPTLYQKTIRIKGKDVLVPEGTIVQSYDDYIKAGIKDGGTKEGTKMMWEIDVLGREPIGKLSKVDKAERAIIFPTIKQKDKWEYLMLPQEQRVRAMTSRDLINKEFGNIKLGNYTKEHAKYLRDQLFKFKSNEIDMMFTGKNRDLADLYWHIKGKSGMKLSPSSDEWLEVMKKHLNKAYIVGGVSTATTLTE